jgi:hypothetical protein
MKVKMLTSIASGDWSYAIGQEVEIHEKLAEAWIKSGLAESMETKEASTEKKKRGKKG